jgi:hypothetical protein
MLIDTQENKVQQLYSLFRCSEITQCYSVASCSHLLNSITTTFPFN